MNRFIFIIGNERVIELIPEDQENLSLGGLDQSFRPDYDTKIAQAYWETYWTLTSEWDESLKYENQFLFITPGPGMPSPPIVSLFDIRETIFEPIE